MRYDWHDMLVAKCVNTGMHQHVFDLGHEHMILLYSGVSNRVGFFDLSVGI